MIPSYILIFHLSLQVHTKIAVSCVPREYEQVKSNELLKERPTQGNFFLFRRVIKFFGL